MTVVCGMQMKQSDAANLHVVGTEMEVLCRPCVLQHHCHALRFSSVLNSLMHAPHASWVFYLMQLTKKYVGTTCPHLMLLFVCVCVCVEMLQLCSAVGAPCESMM